MFVLTRDCICTFRVTIHKWRSSTCQSLFHYQSHSWLVYFPSECSRSYLASRPKQWDQYQQNKKQKTCNTKLGIETMYVYDVVQFYPWFKFSFLLFQTCYSIYNTHKQRKTKFDPRITLNHNIYTCLLFVSLSHNSWI